MNNYRPNLDNERQDIAITDAGRRMADAHELARLAGGQGRWLAVRLDDGRAHGDGTIYDTQADAVRHVGTSFDELYGYVKIAPGPMPPAHATRLLELFSEFKRAGFRLTDPDGPAPILPTGPGTDRLLLPHQHTRLRGLARIMRRDGRYKR